jgi:flagellar hook-length control protein FliK
MSMDPVQFEPKISTDLQANWRRTSSGSGAAADMFTDLLADQMKRRADDDRQELEARRRELSNSWHHPGEQVNGRLGRIVVAHQKTLRGEAKEVEEPARRSLPQPSANTQEESEARTSSEHTADEPESEVKGKPAKARAKTAAEAGDQPATLPADQQPESGPLTIAVVAVQSSEPARSNAGKAPMAAALSLPAQLPIDGQAAAPAPKSDANKATAGNNAGSAEAAEQHASQTAAAALAEALAVLDTEAVEPAGTASPAVDLRQMLPATITQVAGKAPLTQLLQPSAPLANPSPAIQPSAVRPASEIPSHTHSGVPTQASTDTPDSTAGQDGDAPQSTQSFAALPAQALAAGAFDGDSDGFDPSLSADGGAPGWALHLAQGAAGRRADFVAQLRQHLQNVPVQEQVAVHVQRALREGSGRVSIQLSPAELGRIHVKLEIDDDKRVTAAVTVERPSTLELLQRDVKGLERALHDAGLTMEGGDLSFSLGQGADQGFAQDLGQSDANGPLSVATDPAPEVDVPESRVAEVADLSAGVVDLQV